MRFHDGERAAFAGLSERQWREVLAAADAAQLTLALGVRCHNALPEFVQERIARSIASNRKRHEEIVQRSGELMAEFWRRGIDFVFLKGIAQTPFYVDLPEHRPQYDIDVFCQPEDLIAARDAALKLGYEPLCASEKLPVDHLPSMIRKTGWRWRGDYFDPEMPLSLDIHYRFWDAETEAFEVNGIEEFWSRRTVRSTECGQAPTLSVVDGLAYSSLHFLRHLLRGDPRVYHAYEIAHFLERSAGDSILWQQWRSSHPTQFRQVQAVAFRFAADWFGCRTPEAVEAEMASMPDGVVRWFELFASAPLRSMAHPNKDELWLHLELVPDRPSRRRITRRRLLPSQPPKYQPDPHARCSKVRFREKCRRRLQEAHFIGIRAGRHASSLMGLPVSVLRWWWARKGIDPQLLVFLAAAALFNIGQSIFFLLYNLHLLRLGFHEDLMGLIGSALSLGSIAGAIPAGVVARRFGLRAAFLAVPVLGVVRAIAATESLLVVSAFASGFAFAGYAVCLPPIVAALTPERSRPFAFGLVFASGIGAGAIAGLIGGRLPAFLRIPASGTLTPALIAASALAVQGGVLAFRIKLRSNDRTLRKSSVGLAAAGMPFVIRFLAVICVWWAATGVFNPLFNSFFVTRLNMSVERIGEVFAASQSLQVLAVLVAPVLLKQLGLFRGIGWMQMVAGITLMAIGLNTNAYAVSTAYCAYMALQFMSEPGVYTALMNAVPEERRSDASALSMFAMFSVQALAPAAAGFSVRSFGYAAVLSVAACLAISAGLAFQVYLPRRGRIVQERRQYPCDIAQPETVAPIGGDR